MNIIIIGPDPEASYRNGGVAKFVEYQSKLKSTDDVNSDFYLLDWDKLPNINIPNVLRKYLGFITAITKLFVNTSADIPCVHLHTSLYDGGRLKNLLFAAICKWKGYPLFLQIHGGRFSKLTDLSKKMWIATFKLTTKIGVFPGPQFQEIKERGMERKLLRVANFVPSEFRERRKNYEDPHFFFLGRVVKEKGVLLLLDSFLQLKKEGINAKLTIAGSGNELGEIKERTKESKFKDDINITGYVSGEELDEIMNDCNIFVLPSWHEGFPLSFLECSLTGMAPLITTNNGIPYFFEENEEYLPVYLKSNNLFNQMKRIATDTKMRKKIGRKVQKKVKKKFTVETYIPELIDNYRKVTTVAKKN